LIRRKQAINRNSKFYNSRKSSSRMKRSRNRKKRMPDVRRRRQMSRKLKLLSLSCPIPR
jgi:hypothetical protein